MLQQIDFEELEGLDPEQISRMLDQSGLYLVPHRDGAAGKSAKRQYAFNYHDNSDDYKNMGTLHKENRTVEYYPQDEKQDFSTKPQIMGRELPAAGDTLPAARRSGRNESQFSFADSDIDRDVRGFPKTINQDFHNEECFARAAQLHAMDKQNFKKTNPYMAYANAMFNQGVFVNPW